MGALKLHSYILKQLQAAWVTTRLQIAAKWQQLVYLLRAGRMQLL